MSRSSAGVSPFGNGQSLSIDDLDWTTNRETKPAIRVPLVDGDFSESPLEFSYQKAGRTMRGRVATSTGRTTCVSEIVVRPHLRHLRMIHFQRFDLLAEISGVAPNVDHIADAQRSTGLRQYALPEERVARAHSASV